MPRKNTEVKPELYRELYREYSELMEEKEFLNFADIYAAVVKRPAPRFFLSYQQACRIVNRFEKEGRVGCGRKKELSIQRDEAFIAVYAYLRGENPEWPKWYAIRQTMKHPAPSYFITARTAYLGVLSVLKSKSSKILVSE